VVGHSMGAAAAVAAATARPGRYAAVAALGGGGSPRAAEGLERLPFLVAAGGRDFGRPGALALHRRLEGLGLETRFRDYPAVEHLAIVQLALPEVFGFFDEAGGRR
jgi:pimeloyl-ACP methyl ester carboxylesterase